jgi:hypothetical protein
MAPTAFCCVARHVHALALLVRVGVRRSPVGPRQSQSLCEPDLESQQTFVVPRKAR